MMILAIIVVALMIPSITYLENFKSSLLGFFIGGIPLLIASYIAIS